MIKTQTITIEQTVRLLASSDEELLGSRPSDGNYGALAFTLIEFTAFVSSPKSNLLGTFKRLWDIYKAVKRRTQGEIGSILATLLSRRGGGSICDKFDYCNNRERLKELFDLADSPEGKSIFADIYKKGIESKAAEEYIDNINKLHEILSETAEVLAEASKEIAGEVADNAIPGAYVLMCVKYGFDDLCKCCKKCKGEGLVDNKKCSECSGKGHSRVQAHNDGIDQTVPPVG